MIKNKDALIQDIGVMISELEDEDPGIDGLIVEFWRGDEILLATSLAQALMHLGNDCAADGFANWGDADMALVRKTS